MTTDPGLPTPQAPVHPAGTEALPTTGGEATPTGFAGRRAPSSGTVWRLLTPVAAGLAGALMVTSAVNADGGDLRPTRDDTLADLANRESDRVQSLQSQVATLTEEIRTLTDQRAGAGGATWQRELRGLRSSAGLTAKKGPGIRVALDDAPKSAQDAAGAEVSSAIVHQQDIQAVANALWAGGAEAMTLQGQRVISTTGIKCVGNSVILHGVPYSPPYVVEAIGDTERMRSALEQSTYVSAYLQAVEDYQLGWEYEQKRELRAPAYDGSIELAYASEEVMG